MTKESQVDAGTPISGVSEIGPTTPGEDSMRTDARRFRIVAIVAAALLAPQVLVHLLIPWLVLPTFSSMFQNLGAPVPAPTAFILAAGPWLGLLLALVDVLIFWGFYRLARRYWIGLLFAPLWAVGILSGFVVVALYLPMFDVVNVVK